MNIQEKSIPDRKLKRGSKSRAYLTCLKKNKESTEVACTGERMRSMR